jgi:predicted dehydrogenase
MPERLCDHIGGILLDAGVHAVAGLREVLGEVVSLYAQISDYDNETHEAGTLLCNLRWTLVVSDPTRLLPRASPARERAWIRRGALR